MEAHLRALIQQVKQSGYVAPMEAARPKGSRPGHLRCPYCKSSFLPTQYLARLTLRELILSVPHQGRPAAQAPPFEVASCAVKGNGHGQVVFEIAFEPSENGKRGPGKA